MRRTARVSDCRAADSEPTISAIFRDGTEIVEAHRDGHVGTLCNSDELLTAFLQLEAMFFDGNNAGSSCANI
jgi:hypothetical protein